MESIQEFTLQGILTPNPQTKRAQRVRWSVKPNSAEEFIIAYGTQKNLIIRNLKNPKQSKIYTSQIVNNLTCVKYSHNGNYIAYGDEKGGVRVIGWSDAQQNFITKYENEAILGGSPVNDIAWTDDQQKIIVVGAGQKRGVAVNIETNSNCGELSMGHAGTLLSCDIKISKPYQAIVAGEDKQIQTYKGVPFKYEKSIQQKYTNFINKCEFLKVSGGQHFIAVSSDKSIKVFDSTSNESLIEKENIHSMGIIDFCQIENEIATCSSDKTVILHEIDLINKDLIKKRLFEISKQDQEELLDNVDKQQLAISFIQGMNQLIGVQCNSDINFWDLNDQISSPTMTIRGHQNTVNSITNFKNQFIVSGDSDGRILYWNLESGQAYRPKGLFKHKISIVSLCSNQKYVYSSSADQKIMQYELVQSDDDQLVLKSSHQEFIQKESSIIHMIANDQYVYALLSNKSIQILNANNISETIKTSKKFDSLGKNKKGEIQTFALSRNGEIWISDDQGQIFILDKDLDIMENENELKSVYGHPVLSMQFSKGSEEQSYVALGDSKGYITVIEEQSKKQVCYFASHQSKVLLVDFTPDNKWVYSLGFDKLACLNNIQDPKIIRKLASPNDKATTNCSCLISEQNDQNFILTAGSDAAIRIWKY